MLWHHQKIPTYRSQNKGADRRYRTVITPFKQREQNISERGSLKKYAFCYTLNHPPGSLEPWIVFQKAEKVLFLFLSWKRGTSGINWNSKLKYVLSANILHICSTSDYIHFCGAAKFGVWDQTWRHRTVSQNLNFGTKVRGSAEGSDKSSSGSCLPPTKNDNQLLKQRAGRDTALSQLPQLRIKTWNSFKNRLYYGSPIKSTQTGFGPSVQCTQWRNALNGKPS